MTVPRPMPHLEGVRHRYLDAGGLRMHVAEAGDPDADPVLLLHGWPQHWYAWRHLIGPLATDYRVICPDLRGFGWTEAPAGRYLKAELAADVLALMDAMELGQVRLAGHDWGGFVGFLICLEAPERVSHLLAAGIVHPWVEPNRGPLAFLDQIVRLSYQLVVAAPFLGPQIIRHVPAFIRTILKAGAAKEAWDPDELEQFVAQWSEPDRAAACASLYRSFLVTELPKLMTGGYRERSLEIPSTLLLGSKDPVIQPKRVKGGERNAPRLGIRVVDGVGHWIPEEAPEAMLAEMLELFAEGPSNASGLGATQPAR